MLGDLIGEFEGKNTLYRVLSDGKVETSGHRTGKILGIDAFMMNTSVVAMANGVFVGEVNCLTTTMDGDAVRMKGNTISWQSERGGITRSTSCQMIQSQKLMRLNKVIGLHEYETDENGDWKGKIWDWK